MFTLIGSLRHKSSTRAKQSGGSTRGTRPRTAKLKTNYIPAEQGREQGRERGSEQGREGGREQGREGGRGFSVRKRIRMDIEPRGKSLTSKQGKESKIKIKIHSSEKLIVV